MDPLVHDLRLVEDNWESPTLGAWGLGWEVWLNGMEITQFTYFQQAGGLECRPVTGEITYGLERLCMYLQNVDNVFDLVWTVGPQGTVYYRDVYHQNEVEQSTYNFEHADVAELFHRFDACEKEALKLVELNLPLPAYEQVCKASHCFNLLDARRAISVTERQRFILRVRTLSRACAAVLPRAAREARVPRAGARGNREGRGPWLSPSRCWSRSAPRNCRRRRCRTWRGPSSTRICAGLDKRGLEFRSRRRARAVLAASTGRAGAGPGAAAAHAEITMRSGRTATSAWMRRASRRRR